MQIQFIIMGRLMWYTRVDYQPGHADNGPQNHDKLEVSQFTILEVVVVVGW